MMEEESARRWHRKKRFRVPVWILFIFFAASVAAAMMVISHIHRHAQSRDLTREEWAAVYRSDVEALRVLMAQLQASAEKLNEMAASAPDDVTILLPPDEARLVREHWAAVYDATRQIDRLADFHRDFVLMAAGERRADYVRGFLLCDAADLAVQSSLLAVMDNLIGNTRWARLLNEAQPSMGLPENTYAALRNEVLNPERAARQFLARRFHQELTKEEAFELLAGEEETQWLNEQCVLLHRSVEDQIADQGARVPTLQTAGIAGDLSFSAWFPVQKNVANAMGNIRFKESGKYLISDEQIMNLCAEAQPGDIIVTRKNWYLSNAGIPGFWPHAALYVGDEVTLNEFFDDDEVRAWLAGIEARTEDFASFLQSCHPEAWNAYLTSNAGEPNHCVEAIAPGVVFRPAAQTFHADAVALMRPRLNKAEKARAIERAFSNWGKPYDYNFDFQTDNQLVCSELVYKCYQPADDFGGLQLPMGETMGRPLCTPNMMVRMVDEEWGTENAQLDFVAFIDAREAEGIGQYAGADELRASWKRPKWSGEFSR